MAIDIEAPALAPTRPARPDWLRRVLTIGPGLVFVLGLMGPKDLVSNAIAGASDGYGLLWVLVIATVARGVILDATARYVLVTGETLLAGCGRFGRSVTMMWFTVTILRHHLFALSRSVMLGTAAHFIFPLPTPYSSKIWGLASWCAGFGLLYWGRYNWVEKFSRPLAAVMGLCLAIAAIVSRPDFGTFIKGVLHPVLPSEGGQYHSAIVLMAVISTALGSFGNLRYSSFIHEKGWRSLSDLRRQRTDLLTSMLGMFLMLALIQVAAAGALQPRGLHVNKLGDLIPIFSQVVGPWGPAFFGVTLWCVVFSSYVGSGSAFGIMIADVYYRFIRPSPELLERGRPAGEMPAYRWLVLYLFLSPLYVFLTDWTPVGLVLASGVLSVVTLPIMILIVLRLTADRKIMGLHANGWFTNAVLVLAILGAVYLSWEGVGEIISDWKG